MKWKELNKNLPPVMWHGVVGADDNSFLVAVTSRQKCPYNKIHLLNRDLTASWWQLPPGKNVLITKLTL